MLSQAPRSRAYSLRAPIASEGERTQFQRRLAATLTVLFVLALFFFLLQFATYLTAFRGEVARFLGVGSVQAQLATIGAAAIGALLVRAGKRSARFLDVSELASFILVSWGWSLTMALVPNDPAPRGELIALLATTFTLVPRAALVPSTSTRTALISLVSVAPIPALAYSLARGHGDPFAAGVYATIWCLLAVACAATISHIIYGLSLEVRKAMQLGQYLLEQKIGQGGMGVVYRASHALLRRPTAIKLLNGTSGPELARFEREVQITAALTHPNTVAVYDYGRTPEGAFYYAMEYLDGVTLEDLVRTHGPLPPARVAHLLLQLCGALAEAHASGLVHRDIKPANVMLTERGGVPDVVKVLDFGLVKDTASRGGASVSNVNAIVGTPHYMAPEAILDPLNVDARADLYAVGATAYYLLTGATVFDGRTLVEVCGQHLHQDPTPIATRRPEVPPALDALVLRCLAKEPEGRPATADELAEALRALGLPGWSRAEASSWWASSETQAAIKRRSLPAPASTTSAFGDTIAIVLDDRRVG